MVDVIIETLIDNFNEIIPLDYFKKIKLDQDRIIITDKSDNVSKIKLTRNDSLYNLYLFEYKYENRSLQQLQEDFNEIVMKLLSYQKIELTGLKTKGSVDGKKFSPTIIINARRVDLVYLPDKLKFYKEEKCVTNNHHWHIVTDNVIILSILSKLDLCFVDDRGNNYKLSKDSEGIYMYTDKIFSVGIIGYFSMCYQKTQIEKILKDLKVNGDWIKGLDQIVDKIKRKESFKFNDNESLRDLVNYTPYSCKIIEEKFKIIKDYLFNKNFFDKQATIKEYKSIANKSNQTLFYLKNNK
ncbi:hypothetical protein A0H76_626 [Hepatospora eriocheir]|uniref:Uncharacterized protein n=1 Tax=Hepatospora eriocheir TaxID=1081669 RepID=A0A1X0QIH2_9MICR|nr:hypothetical protein A0H76_626 [Hepatospora eriocheir]